MSLALSAFRSVLDDSYDFINALIVENKAIKHMTNKAPIAHQYCIIVEALVVSMFSIFETNINYTSPIGIYVAYTMSATISPLLSHKAHISTSLSMVVDILIDGNV